MSELLWVAVPGGTFEREVPGRTFERGALLRVLIVPKLQGGSLVDHGMQSWPPRSLVEATLEVQFAELAAEPDAATAQTVQVNPDVAAQPEVWERLFAHTTVETPGLNAQSVVRLHIEPTSARADAIKETFEESAKAGITEVAQGADFDMDVRAQLAEHWSGPEPPVAESTVEVLGVTPALVDPVNASEPGFNRMISLLREHPTVLKALGLIIELRVAAADVPFPEGFVRVRWTRAPETLPAVVSPWTQYESHENQFLPASTANISAAMVTLTDDRTEAGDPRWEVVSVDVDGAVGRLRAAARTLVRSTSDGAPVPHRDQPTVDQPATLPTLRSAGLQLVRPGRRDDFATRLRRSMSDAALTADDLLLGYRVDIRPSGGEWFSLHKRRATYTAHERDSTGRPSNDVIIIGSAETLEEGHIKPYAATSDDNGTLHADEIAARWGGWSLAVHKPKFEAPTATPNATRPPQAALPFSWEFHVEKGSLPRLRFGQEYSIRARAVDMAGGGLELDDPAADRCATRPFKYTRYETVTSPDVTLSSGVNPAKLGPSEAVDHVVIRSDPAIGLSVEDFARQNPRHTPNPVRVLHPSRTTFAIAEQHGMFDLEGEDEEAIARQTWEWVKRAFPPAGQPESPLSGEPRLPDPAAGSVLAVPRHEPATPAAASADQAWDGPWPDLKPKQVELTTPQAGRAAIAWEDQRLVVRLAPAEQVTLELSTLPRSDILGEFEVLKKIREQSDVDLPDESMLATKEGRHPMISPARTLTFVHAVRRPLLPPEPTLSVRREPGENFATLKPKSPLLGVDPKSTGQIEVTATWEEPDDNQTREVPETPVQTVIVGRGDVTLKDTLRHEFGDTRHRNVTYTLKAVSRFRPYFEQADGDRQADDDPAPFTQLTHLDPINIPSSGRPPAPIVLSTGPAFAWEEEATLDLPPSILTRRRLGGRLRVELQPPWHQTGEGELLGIVVRTFEFEEEFFEERNLWPHVTRVGTDPIELTRGMRNRLPGKEFTSTSGSPRELLLQDVQHVDDKPVVVLPHEVWFRDGRWFADIALPGVAKAEYCPFVQLAVARYQPNSIEGHELSQVVQTEMVPLLPERTLTVNSSHSGFVEVRLDGVDRPISSTYFRNRVDMILEQLVLGGDPILPPEMPTSAVDLTALGAAPDGIPVWVERASTSGDLNDPIRLGLPSSEEFLAGALRIRVREVELVNTRATANELPPEPQMGSSGELQERTVFTDVVPLELSPR
jgi:hypothetical protein